jgi:hypothetical protein
LAVTELPDELLKLTLNLDGDWRFKAVVWTPRMSGPTTGSKQRVQRRIRLRCLAPAQIESRVTDCTAALCARSGRWVAMLKQHLDEGFDMIDREEEDSPNSTED